MYLHGSVSSLILFSFLDCIISINLSSNLLISFSDTSKWMLSPSGGCTILMFILFDSKIFGFYFFHLFIYIIYYYSGSASLTHGKMLTRYQGTIKSVFPWQIAFSQDDGIGISHSTHSSTIWPCLSLSIFAIWDFKHFSGEIIWKFESSNSSFPDNSMWLRHKLPIGPSPIIDLQKLWSE